jgi:hypothetical protein
MEQTQIFDLMGELKLCGMKAAFDEIMATAVKRQHEPQRIVGDLLTAEINEKQARSIKYQLTYFTESTADGWTYRDGKHLDYYLAHSLPVLVVLYHPKSREAWWQHVSEETIRRRIRAGRYAYRGISGSARGQRPEAPSRRSLMW